MNQNLMSKQQLKAGEHVKEPNVNEFLSEWR